MIQNNYKYKIDFNAIAKKSLKEAKFLLETILPGGVQRGAEWIVKNPKRSDSKIGSFKINVNSGRWADFATSHRGGDLISLVAYLDGISQFDAARKLINLLGGSNERKR